MGVRDPPAESAGALSLPSTLAYRDRIELKSLDTNTYARLYCTGTDQAVWDRLHVDAGVRSSSKALRPTRMEPLFASGRGNPFAAKAGISGYVSNTSPAVYDTKTTFKTGHLTFQGETPLEAMQPMLLKKFKEKNGLEYHTAIRKDAETTTQTLRMLGTYSTDFAHARQANVFIPHGCPGGPAAGSWFHPDVRLTKSAEFPSRPKA